MMKTNSTLITGGLGYLGSVLHERLVAEGLISQILDCGLYQTGDHEGPHKTPEASQPHPPYLLDLALHEEIPDLLIGVEAIIHLAALESASSCDLWPDFAVRTNYHGTLSLARRARLAGVRRFIFASTCLFYDTPGEKPAHELAPILPRNLWQQTKAQAEVELLSLASPDFAVTILRLAPLFGPSPCMRFDLEINSMIKSAWQHRLISIPGKGRVLRPYLYVEDAARVIHRVTTAPEELVRGQIFNVAPEHLHLSKGDIAAEIAAHFAGTKIVSLPDRNEDIPLKVSSQKLWDRLGVMCPQGLSEGIAQVSDCLSRGLWTDPDHPMYDRYGALKSKKRDDLVRVINAAKADLWQSVDPPQNLRPRDLMALKIPHTQPLAIRRGLNPPLMVIYARDDAPGLPHLCATLPPALLRTVRLIDDGSKDATSAMGRMLGLSVLRYDRSMGLGRCLKHSLEIALETGHERFLMVDARSPLPLSDLLDRLPQEALASGDLILGSRLIRPYEALSLGMPVWQYMLVALTTLVTSGILGFRRTDLVSTFILARTRWLDSLAIRIGPDDRFLPLRILGLAALTKARFQEVPIPPKQRSARPLTEVDGPNAALGWLREMGTLIFAKLGLYIHPSLRGPRAAPVLQEELRDQGITQSCDKEPRAS